jgi:large subunit ribosomal protein L10
MERAAAEAGIDDLGALLVGPTAVAFVDGDVVTAAKQVVDASKRFPALVLKGAYLDGRVLSAAEAQSLATLDTREVMLSKIAGLLKMEMNRAASMFQAVQSRFLGVLEAYKEKVPGDAATEAPEASEPAEASTPSGEGDTGNGIEASAEDAAPAAETDGAEAETAPTEHSDAEVATAVDGDDGEPAEESAEAPEAGSASDTNDEIPTHTSTDGTQEA